MLFDLRGRGRRRTVQGIYLFLAVLMGGGLIFFGVGGTGVGLFNTNDSGGSGGSISNAPLKRAQTAVRRHPDDPRAWDELTRRQLQSADYDQNTQSYTNKAQLRQIAASWKRYLALEKGPQDANLAAQMLDVFGAQQLNQPADAVAAAEIVTEHSPKNAGAYLQLAQYAYLAGQTRKGDLASTRLIALTPKANRQQLKSQLKTFRAQALARSGQTTTPSGG